MRSILALAFVLCCAPAFAKEKAKSAKPAVKVAKAAKKSASFRAKFFSSRQLSKLTPEKREKYIRAYSKILARFEKIQNTYQLASRGPGLEEANEYIARLWPELMPKALADDGVAGTCGIPGELNCQSLSETERVAAIARFRSNGRTDDAVCITGGFFSNYAGGVKRAGGCEGIRVVPGMENMGKMVKCDSQKRMCNPAVFCLSGNMSLVGLNKRTPILFCAENTGNLTEDCETQYLKYAAGVESPEGMSGNKVEKCTMSEFSDLPLQRLWDENIARTQGMYRRFCMEHEDFQALFCKECSILGKAIAEANLAAGGSACLDETGYSDVPVPSMDSPSTADPADAIPENTEPQGNEDID